MQESKEEILDDTIQVVAKKIRNKRKKLEKIKETKQKVASKKITLEKEQEEMLASEESVISQLKDLEEISKSLLANQKKVSQIIASAEKADSKEEREKRVDKILNRLADALLVNSISENFNEHYLSVEGHDALTKAV